MNLPINRREFLTETAVIAGSVVLGTNLQASELDLKNYCVEVARADVPNSNKRIYPKHVLEQAIKDFKPCLGQMGINHENTINISKVSHFTHKIELKKGYLMADVEILDTPEGRKLLKLLPNMAFRLRGVGHGKIGGNGVLTVGDYYKLISIDAYAVKDASVL